MAAKWRAAAAVCMGGLLGVHGNDVCAGSSSALLWNEVEMPMLGFGTAAMRGSETRAAVRVALKAGFRHFDGAEATEWYDDAAVGEELEAAVAEGLVTREELFIVSKVHPANFGKEATKAALEAMLDTLRTPYLDLVLLHFPECGSWNARCGLKSTTWRDAWPVLEEFYDSGKLRAIGVSNFDATLLTTALSEVRVKPHVVQNWMDPFHQDREVRKLCKEHDIAYTSYSTLGGQWEHRKEGRNIVAESEVIQRIAKELGKHWTTVVLMWALQRDAMVLPRSTSEAHIRSNAELLQADHPMLSEEQLAAIDALEKEGWYP